MGTYKKVLKEFRTDNNLAQKQMADKLGISREYYSRLEAGKVVPSRKLFFKICSLTGKQLFLPDESKSARELEMCFICANLNEQDRRAFKLKMMKVIKSMNKIQPLIVGLLFQLCFNFDFSNNIFINIS